MRGGAFKDPALSERFADGLPIIGPPPELLRFDEESTSEEFLSPVRATLVEQQAHRRDIITVRAITERVIPQYAHFGKQAQGTLRTRVEQAARRIADEMPGTYGYRPKTEGHDEAAVRILETPEDRDPRGRTQSYQRIARGSVAKPKERKPSPPGHLRLFDELDDIVAEDEGEGPEDDEEET